MSVHLERHVTILTFSFVEGSLRLRVEMSNERPACYKHGGPRGHTKDSRIKARQRSVARQDCSTIN